MEPLVGDERGELIDIVEVISQHIPLERTGKGFFGMCPRCSEIVWIDPEEQTAWCEGNVGTTRARDVFEFARHYNEF